MRSRRGFTVVELLVVVAIVGVLSAMLFPVFTRTREERRAAWCLANVQQIARAMRMYASDYDGRLFAGEHDPRVQGYFRSTAGITADEDCPRVTWANPYLRAPVLLDSYLRHRDVWQCPAAKSQQVASWIVPPGPNGDWLRGYQEHADEGAFRHWNGGPCSLAWPAGWGGEITDSFVQGFAYAFPTWVTNLRMDPEAFAQSIAPNKRLTDLTLAQVNNPSHYVAVGDYGRQFRLEDAESLAFPDTCAASYRDQGGPTLEMPCHGAPVGNGCPSTVACGFTSEDYTRFLTRPRVRLRYTRHYGGSNVGFLDGHAAWYSSDYLITKAPPFPHARLEGICSCWIDSYQYRPDPPPAPVW